ncbi:Unknown protein, partial [Striga hermonthica]
SFANRAQEWPALSQTAWWCPGSTQSKQCFPPTTSANGPNSKNNRFRRMLRQLLLDQNHPLMRIRDRVLNKQIQRILNGDMQANNILSHKLFLHFMHINACEKLIKFISE